MDDERFDHIARTLANGLSRRQALRRLIGGAAGGALTVAGARAADAQASKVNVCHIDDEGVSHLISVSVNAVPAHQAHGDAIDPSFMDDPLNCGGCGIVCDDGNACTSNLCIAGVCSHPLAVDCSSSGDQCNVGACDPATGSCYTAPVADGTACNDGNLCTESDICTAGVCGGTAVDCSSEDDQCNVGACDPGNGGCYAVPVADGTGCDDGNACTTGDICTNGICGGTSVDCSGENDQCVAGVCNESDGSCDTIPANEGDACTAAGGVDGTCVNGACEPICGSLSGQITNAANGAAIAGATVTVDGQTATTDASGNYSFACVAAGIQTISASATGFTSATRDTTIVAGSSVIENLSLPPFTTADQIRVVLTWGTDPRDLDSHMSGPDVETANTRFHIAYYQKNPVSYASLDVDDTTSNGPETVTVIEKASTGQFVPGDYHYWVHNFTTTPEFDVSGAVVTIFQDNAQIAQYAVSGLPGGPADDIWLVVNFTLAADGSIALTPIQTLVPGNSGSIF